MLLCWESLPHTLPAIHTLCPHMIKHKWNLVKTHSQSPEQPTKKRALDKKKNKNWPMECIDKSAPHLYFRILPKILAPCYVCAI